MPTDLAQRHEVVTRTRSMRGRTQLLDQAARLLTAPEWITVAASIEAAPVLVFLSRSARTGLIAARPFPRGCGDLGIDALRCRETG